jgi:hypothetical protein
MLPTALRSQVIRMAADNFADASTRGRLSVCFRDVDAREIRIPLGTYTSEGYTHNVSATTTALYLLICP